MIQTSDAGYALAGHIYEQASISYSEVGYNQNAWLVKVSPSGEIPEYPLIFITVPAFAILGIVAVVIARKEHKSRLPN
jgi:hypothetical protein